jgi:flagellum-specific peptidoglycan hydrolase FlgJ
MKNRVIGLLTCFVVGTATLGGAKALVNHICTDSNAQMSQDIESPVINEADAIRDRMIEELIAEYENARDQLAIEVDNYILSVAPKANIDPYLMIDLCSEYDVDIRFVLAQGQIESHFATKGTAARTLSIFNVGAYDGHSASRQRRNGFGFSDPNESIEPYLQLITTEYMVNGKTESDLMKNYVNGLGMRYASNPRYESMLRSVYKRISNRPAFNIAYENYLESQNNLELC